MNWKSSACALALLLCLTSSSATTPALLTVPQDSSHPEQLKDLYRAQARPLLWSNKGVAAQQTIELVEHLLNATTIGLRPQDYGAQELASSLSALPTTQPMPLQGWASFDVRMSAALLSYVNDAHFGRIDPRAAGLDLAVERSRLDVPGTVLELSRSKDVAASLRAIEPPFHHYDLLKRALARYRDLARDPTLTALPPLPQRSLRSGDLYPGVAQLRRLLIALGDLPSSTIVRSGAESFDASLAEALKAFQARHGLDTDGILGRESWRALTTPLAERVRQIELTLERWRWLPPRLEGHSIFVNIPQFRLFAFPGIEDRLEKMLSMDVVVGEAIEQSHTPVFVADMTHLILRPYWDVPYGIAVRELLPKIRAHPEYLADNRFEIVSRSGGGPFPATAGNLQAIASGAFRLRQQPGPENALGLVKFVLPNRFNVYLHDTPARALFARSRRAFSHGCIRLADALALAEYVLRDNSQWTRERLIETMNGMAPTRIDLPRPIRVFIVYGTVIARERGDVMFFEDLYGYDARLRRLLDK